MAGFLDSVNRVVWGFPTIGLILGVGLLLSVRTGFAQIRLFPHSVRFFFGKFRQKSDGEGNSSFRALCTALAATVGTGNLVGVAGAIALGGPGSIFWMWICALLGMMTKFAEATLAVCFRNRNSRETMGGPMYMIRYGLGDKWHPLACVYCILGIFASFGVGNAAQIDALLTGIGGVADYFGMELTSGGKLLLGAGLALLVAFLMLGGAGRIGSAAELLVPLVSCWYVALCLCVLLQRCRLIPGAVLAIVGGAFSPSAFTGGMVGSLFQTLRIGVARGVFTNEAGMGTASIAHGGAKVEMEAQQGLMGIMEVFLDTIVICTLTALVILVSGVEIPYGIDAGGSLTIQAFSAVCGGWVSVFLAVAMCCFAFATILGWSLYGARCAQYLFGADSWKPYALAQSTVVLLACMMKTATVWTAAEILNGLMAIPNLIALVGLRGKVSELTLEYETKRG